MSRAGSKRRADRPRKREAKAPRRIVPWRAVGVTLAGALIVAALAWWGIGRRPSTPLLSPPPLDPEIAHRDGMALARQRRFLESLPLLRRVVEADPGSWRSHHDYATALLNAVHEGRRHLGHDEPAMRSSPERVAMMREALVELTEAERVAGGDARGVAWARRTRAQALSVWGFPWESFVSYRQAEWADPGWNEIAGIADRFMDEMKRPTQAEN